MLFPEHIIESIEGCVEWADRLTRTDLAAGIVVTENDYTSNFTAALRREIARVGWVERSETHPTF
jgi:hypothetical protein